VSAPEGVEYYKTSEVAARLRISKMTVTRLILTGDMPGSRIGRDYRIPVKAFEAWLVERKVAEQ